MLMQRKTMFDIVREADEDDADNIINGSIDANDTPEGGDDADDAGSDNTDQGDDQENNEDNLDIDASLDGTGDDDNEGGGDTSSDSSMGSSSMSTTTDEEPIKKNTDIFGNLTSEEQAIKISELKRLYNELYTSCDDYIAKFNDLDYDNISISVVERISTAFSNLKAYMGEYILHVFPIKSYIENDYKYNEFLYVFHSIASILEDISANKQAKKP